LEISENFLENNGHLNTKISLNYLAELLEAKEDYASPMQHLKLLRMMVNFI